MEQLWGSDEEEEEEGEEPKTGEDFGKGEEQTAPQLVAKEDEPGNSEDNKEPSSQEDQQQLDDDYKGEKPDPYKEDPSQAHVNFLMF